MSCASSCDGTAAAEGAPLPLLLPLASCWRCLKPCCSNSVRVLSIFAKLRNTTTSLYLYGLEKLLNTMCTMSL